MSKPPSTARGRLRSCVACISIVAFLVPPPVLAAAPVVERDRATPVTTIDREQLESLQGTRNVADLLKICPARTIPTVTRGPQVGDGGSSASGLSCLQPDDLRVIDIYKAHNDARALFGSQPLAWDPQLAAQAASYGPELAKYGRPVHSSRVGRETSRENLLQALPGTSPQNMVNVWISERRYFVPGTFPNVSSTGNWADVGHYTQMVWPMTTNLGCAIHNGGQFDWLICRYSPPGNRDGSAIGLPPPIIAQAPVTNFNNPAPAAPQPADPDDLGQVLADAAAKSGFAPQSSIADVTVDSEGRVPSNPDHDLLPWEIRKLDQLAEIRKLEQPDSACIGELYAYMAAAEFAPFPWVRFRGADNRAARAPNIFELFDSGDRPFPGPIEEKQQGNSEYELFPLDFLSFRSDVSERFEFIPFDLFDAAGPEVADPLALGSMIGYSSPITGKREYSVCPRPRF